MSSVPPSTLSMQGLSQTPAISTDDTASQSETLQIPHIWRLFRAAINDEKTHIEIGKADKKRKKALHYCIACSNKKRKVVWATAYTSNATDHYQRQHEAEWSAFSGINPHQRSILQYTSPVNNEQNRL